MRLIPIQDFTDELWYAAYKIFYDHDTNVIMGTDPSNYRTPPGLVVFYEVVNQKVANGILKGWLFTNSEDIPVGYIILDKTKGEWELGISIMDGEERRKGNGARATLKVLAYAFEEMKVPWVTAFTLGTDLSVPKQVQRVGFQKLYHFWVMSPDIWERTWKGRIKWDGS